MKLFLKKLDKAVNEFKETTKLEPNTLILNPILFCELKLIGLFEKIQNCYNISFIIPSELTCEFSFSLAYLANTVLDHVQNKIEKKPVSLMKIDKGFVNY